MKTKHLWPVLLLVLFLILMGCGAGSGTDAGGVVIPNVSSGGSGGSGGSGSSVGSISLAWDPNTESDLAGYKLHIGTASRVYSQSINVGKVTTYTLSNLTKGNTYFVVATAYDTSNNESGYSNEVSGVPE
jgi:hypothetical protein